MGTKIVQKKNVGTKTKNELYYISSDLKLVQFFLLRAITLYFGRSLLMLSHMSNRYMA